MYDTIDKTKLIANVTTMWGTSLALTQSPQDVYVYLNVYMCIRMYHIQYTYFEINNIHMYMYIYTYIHVLYKSFMYTVYV